MSWLTNFDTFHLQVQFWIFNITKLVTRVYHHYAGSLRCLPFTAKPIHKRYLSWRDCLCSPKLITSKLLKVWNCHELSLFVQIITGKKITSHFLKYQTQEIASNYVSTFISTSILQNIWNLITFTGHLKPFLLNILESVWQTGLNQSVFYLEQRTSETLTVSSDRERLKLF